MYGNTFDKGGSKTCCPTILRLPFGLTIIIIFLDWMSWFAKVIGSSPGNLCGKQVFIQSRKSLVSKRIINFFFKKGVRRARNPYCIPIFLLHTPAAMQPQTHIRGASPIYTYVTRWTIKSKWYNAILLNRKIASEKKGN